MGVELQRELTLDLLVELMLRASKPHLLVIEDIQWADATTLEFVQRLIERAKQVAIMMLMNCRPEFPSESGVATLSNTLNLRRLGDEELKQLIARVAADRELPSEIVDRIAWTADGVPLFAEELTKTVLESGTALKQADAGARGIHTIPVVPTSLHDSLVSRLDRLGPAKEVAQRAAIIGRPFKFAILHSMAGLPERVVSDGLADLVESGLIYCSDDPHNAIYHFKHALVQLAAYESLLPSARQQLHRQVVESLGNESETARTEPEFLAQHCEWGGLVERAIEYWLLAGKRAFSRSANLEAAAHLRAGRALLPNLLDLGARNQRELQLLMILGPALAATSGFAAAEVGEVYATARRLCEAVPENADKFPALWGSWVFFLVKGELELSRRFAEEMLVLAERIGLSACLVEAHWTLGNALYWLGQLEPARQHLETSCALYSPEHHVGHALLYGQDPYVAAQCYLAFVYWMLGRPSDSEAALQNAERVAENLDHPFTTAWPMAFYVVISSHRRDYAAGLRWAQKLIEFSREQKQQYWLQAAVIVRGWAWANMGDVETGIEEMKKGIAAYVATGAGVSLPHFRGLLVEALIRARRTAEAATQLSQAFRDADANGERVAQISLWRIKGELARTIDSSKQSEAIDCYRKALAMAKKYNAPSAGLRAGIMLHRALAEIGGNVLAGSPLPQLLIDFPTEVSTPDLVEGRAMIESTSF